jgi:nucleotide-binding universal stress UspA family protein
VTFPSILCGVDGSRIAAEAARQAAILAGRRARLTLLGVAWEENGGLNLRPTREPHRLAAALETARLEARALGVSPSVEIRESREDTATLLAEAAHHDLLVLGASSPSRATGTLAGSTAGGAAHASPVPVLLARRPPALLEFPDSIVAAIDGTPATVEVATTTAALARAHRARVTVVAPREVGIAEHRRIADAIATIAITTGAEPVVLDEHSTAHKAIAGAAASVDAGLVVIGSRGLQGVHALTSVSERVAHEAPCSVLILRPR